MITKTLIAIPVYLSPFILTLILFETSANSAYSSDSDSLGIPLLGYLFLFFPIALYLVSKVQRGRLRKPQVIFWNPQRHAFSAVSLVLTIYPLGLFWLAFLLVGFESRSYASVVGAALVFASTALVRTFAIQPKFEE